MKQLGFLSILLLLTAPLCAAEPTTVGYVDMQKVLENSKMGRQAQDTLKEKFDERRTALEQEGQALGQLRQTLTRDQALMSQAELDKKKGELQNRLQKFQTEAAAVQKELQEEQNKLGSEILGPAQEIIAEIAKEKSVSAIFERRQSGLLYVDDALDLTDEVIKRLDTKN